MNDSTVNKSMMKATDVDPVVLEATQLGDAGPLNGTVVPQRILIVPLGEVKSTAGTFIADEDALAATVAAFEAHKTDLPIDYEHQTLGGAYSSPNGQAPAAGWIKSLVIVASDGSVEASGENFQEPGLWAEVAWTLDARQQLANRHYRYLSPVVLVRRNDRRIVGLHSVALTNKPAIVGMRPVVNSDAAVAVLENSEDKIAAGADVPTADVVMTALRTTLSLENETTEAVVLQAALQRIRALEAADANRQAEDRVVRAMSSGKLTTAQREWALALAQRSPAEFDRWESSAPRLVAWGRTTSPDGATNSGNSRRRAVESAVRAEWQSHRAFLEKLCTEEAYVANVIRQCGLE